MLTAAILFVTAAIFIFKSSRSWPYAVCAAVEARSVSFNHYVIIKVSTQLPGRASAAADTAWDQLLEDLKMKMAAVTNKIAAVISYIGIPVSWPGYLALHFGLRGSSCFTFSTILQMATRMN